MFPIGYSYQLLFHILDIFLCFSYKKTFFHSSSHSFLAQKKNSLQDFSMIYFLWVISARILHFWRISSLFLVDKVTWVSTSVRISRWFTLKFADWVKSLFETARCCCWIFTDWNLLHCLLGRRNGRRNIWILWRACVWILWNVQSMQALDLSFFKALISTDKLQLSKWAITLNRRIKNLRLKTRRLSHRWSRWKD